MPVFSFKLLAAFRNREDCMLQRYIKTLLHSFFIAQMDITRMAAADEQTYIAVLVFHVTKITYCSCFF